METKAQIRQKVKLAAKNLLGKAYETYSQFEFVESNIALATYMLWVIEADMTKDELEAHKKGCHYITYLASLEAKIFMRKARLAYGIIEPAGALLIWLSITSGNSIPGFLYRQEVDWDFSNTSNREERKLKEYYFLKRPPEELQNKMGGLPILDTAVLASISELDADLENKVKKFSGSKLENIFRDTNYEHFIIIDNSVAMNDIIDRSKSNKKGISYTAQILLDAIKNKEVFVGFSSLAASEKMVIKTNEDVRRFWMQFGADRFNRNYKTTIPYIIEDFLTLSRYIPFDASKKTCLTIITCDYDGFMYSFPLEMRLASGNIKLNLIILAPTELFKNKNHPINVTNDVSIFSLENEFLVDTTQEIVNRAK